MSALALFDDPLVVEIMLNPPLPGETDGRIWEDRIGAGMSCIGTMTATAAESFISQVASTHRSIVTRDSPYIECELPIRGARFTATSVPITPFPSFNIRLLAIKLFTLADYVEQGIMTPYQRSILEDAAATRKNILVSGGTSSGKTTATNAILDAMATATPTDRFVILQETIELKCAAQNVVALKATKNVDLLELVRLTLRMRPDRIIVGEVRGREAHPMIKAWNTGHEGGVCTIHANSALAALTRLERLIAEATQADMRADIAEAIHYVVHITKTQTNVRKVLPIVRITGLHDGQYITETLEG